MLREAVSIFQVWSPLSHTCDNGVESAGDKTSCIRQALPDGVNSTEMGSGLCEVFRYSKAHTRDKYGHVPANYAVTRGHHMR